MSLKQKLARSLAMLAAGFALSANADPAVATDHNAYYPGEPITVLFSGGPGNKLDWLGTYPDGVTPGSQNSTVWRYVDNTQGGATPYTDGSVVYPAGLDVGAWTTFFLLNDGYDILAQTNFNVVDATAPLARSLKRTYLPGEAITITFTNGPGNAKDWIGLYKAGETPGGPASTDYLYVDGTQGGSTPLTSGSVTFSSGLTGTGDYVAFFLENDGYNVLASEAFTIKAGDGTPPKVASVTPANLETNALPAQGYTATLQQGSAPIVVASVSLAFDGVAVTNLATAQGDKVLVSYATDVVLPVASSHKYTLTFADTAGLKVTNEVQFVVGPYQDIHLPAPIVFENFDSVPEGELPAGWTQKGYSTPLNPDVDFTDLGSAAYQTWTAVNADRFTGSFKTYGDPTSSSTDYQRVLSVNPRNVLNGKVFNAPLASGRFVFGNSGYQNGDASQVLYLFSPDFDLTGKSNVFVSFKSLWEQNQDSIAALEYSVDQGTNWLPVFYLLEPGDIVHNDDGSVDSVTTFATETIGGFQGIAVYTDDDGNEVGGHYGAFIGADPNSDLSAFIQARVDDDPFGSKRIELYPLPQAANQPKVRFRFATAGSDSWYWGVDDFGLYSISSVATPALTITPAGGQLTLTFTGAAGAMLQAAASLSAPDWQPVPGVVGNSVTLTPNAAQQYFRVVQP
ncbi:MAG TPA: hypothetical protein VMB21_06625 [Candidatus Limnocylindria bacterium]|nr:hypothetical protein [Candidatus Limnocylindria bacterium]